MDFEGRRLYSLSRVSVRPRINDASHRYRISRDY